MSYLNRTDKNKFSTSSSIESDWYEAVIGFGFVLGGIRLAAPLAIGDRMLSIETEVIGAVSPVSDSKLEFTDSNRSRICETGNMKSPVVLVVMATIWMTSALQILATETTFGKFLCHAPIDS